MTQSLIGEKLADEYEVVEALGNGASSVVYKALRIKDGKPFAIKLLHRYLIEKEDTARRFEQEAKAAMLLSHPNIVRMRGLNKTADGQPYLVMDFISGQSLAEIITEGALPLPRAWKLFVQIADAMSHAHSQGVVHRSLKPGNIIISKENGQEKAVVSDFGLAKLLPSSGQEIQNLTAKGAIVGSPLYMSPEQCLGREIDGRTDIYALGCLMYTCITGKPPLKGEHIIDTMSKHVGEIPLTFEKVCPELKIPGQVQAIVFKCMAKRPEDRYESMELVKADLLRYQQGKRPKAMSGAADFLAQQQEEHPSAKEEPVVDEDRLLKMMLVVILVMLVGLASYAVWKTPQRKNPGDIELGKSFLESQRNVHPISPLALLKQADELKMMNRDEEARALYREAILKSRDKDNERTTPVDNEVLATAHYGLAGIYSRLGDWTEAEKELRLSLYVQELCGPGAAPGKDRLHLDLAACLMRQGRLKEARELLDQVRNESSETLTTAKAFLMLSDLANVSKNSAEAESWQSKCIEALRGKKGIARRFYCIVLSRYADQLIRQKQFDKCAAVLKSAINEIPVSSWDEYDADAAIFLSVEIARTLASAGDYKAGIAVCKNTLDTISSNTFHNGEKKMGNYTPDTGPLTDAIASLEALSGDPAAAEKSLDGSLGFDGERMGRIATLCRIYLQQKRCDDAISLLSKFKLSAMKQPLLKGEYHALMALCLLQKQKNHEALKESDQAIDAIKSTSDEALHFYCLRVKCQVLRALKRNDAADLIEQTIGTINPVSAEFDSLLPAYQRQGIGG